MCFFIFGGSIIQWMKTIYYLYVRFNGLKFVRSGYHRRLQSLVEFVMLNLQFPVSCFVDHCLSFSSFFLWQLYYLSFFPKNETIQWPKTDNTMAKNRQYNGQKQTTQWPKKNRQYNGQKQTIQWPTRNKRQKNKQRSTKTLHRNQRQMIDSY